ncbi:cell division protein ZapA [Thalassotalea sp. PLHSN55]|uniref:cell division protein ZapA n=1 Tax=Thalassotalea sp. PLHSN55 TaxID=3435888 RepID=UPI003F840CA3
MAKNTLDVTIAARKLRIACPKGQESALLSAATEVNNRAELMGKSSAVTSSEQAMIMAALNLAHELATVKAKLAQEKLENKNKIKLLQSSFEQALNPSNNKRA